MTRFARAKGSKASNERAPEDGTPWEVMKEQLAQSKREAEETKKRQEADKKRQENYDNFLKEQKVSKRKSTWCDFPVEGKRSKIETVKDKPKHKKNKSKNGKNTTEDNKSTQQMDMTDQANVEKEIPQKKNKKRNKSKNNNTNTEDNNESTQQMDMSEQANVEKEIPQKKNKKRNKSKNNNTNTEDNNESTQQMDTTELANVEQEKPQKKSKRKNKSINDNISTDNIITEPDAKEIDVSTEQTDSPLPHKKRNKNKHKKQQNNEETNTEPQKQNKNKTSVNNHNIKPKKKDGNPTRRKPIEDSSFRIIINGKEVELQRYDGFPVMKKDAERLQELKQSMINKGIPKSEVQRTIKLERRRAEKALARVKRDVCYNCRKGGHNLSDCPELKSKVPGVDAADGICFKCGSTEHRSHECKVQRDQGFRFATCFICKEQGHIARQCPDNPKGLYPNGGGCKLCGDVTHLRKDCPTSQDKREESNIRLDTYDNVNNLEGIGSEEVTTKPAEDKPKAPKKIQF